MKKEIEIEIIIIIIIFKKTKKLHWDKGFFSGKTCAIDTEKELTESLNC